MQTEPLPPSSYVQELILEDFQAFFSDEDKARRAFALFDANEDGTVSLRECRDTIRYACGEKNESERGTCPFGGVEWLHFK